MHLRAASSAMPLGIALTRYICGITELGKLRTDVHMEKILKKVNNGSCNTD